MSTLMAQNLRKKSNVEPCPLTCPLTYIRAGTRRNELCSQCCACAGNLAAGSTHNVHHSRTVSYVHGRTTGRQTRQGTAARTHAHALAHTHAHTHTIIKPYFRVSPIFVISPFVFLLFFSLFIGHQTLPHKSSSADSVRRKRFAPGSGGEFCRLGMSKICPNSGILTPKSNCHIM